jgi:hypothetical protein
MKITKRQEKHIANIIRCISTDDFDEHCSISARKICAYLQRSNKESEAISLLKAINKARVLSGKKSHPTIDGFLNISKRKKRKK